MRDFVDLHTHSHCSDGTCAPAQLVEEAARLGLGAIALTDHNTVAGLAEFLRAAEHDGIQAVPGVEISAEYCGREVHIVGLFLAPEVWGTVTDYLAVLNHRKTESNRALVRRLQEAGYQLDLEQLLQNTQGTVNRAVIAAKMMELGYVSSIQEAIKGPLSQDRGFYVPPQRLDAFDVIRFLRSVGAVSVLAHPYLSLEEGQLREFLPEAKAHGLVAMETRYSTYTPETASAATALAKQYGILESGGSDFHGQNKPDIRLGTGRGNLRVPLCLLSALEEKRTMIAGRESHG